jgi:dinuclear metal center YbgI/SA1388 family protein
MLKPEGQIPIRVSDIVGLMEKIAPPYLAESWDNCGLQVGDLQWPVQKVWVALDPLFSVIDAAVRQDVDLVITHHPLIFKPLHRIDLEKTEGKIIAAALKNRTAIYAAHTNLDSAGDGINMVLARRIGLNQLEPLVPADLTGSFADTGSATTAGLGMGRVGRLDSAVTVGELARDIKKQLGIANVKIAGRADRMIGKVAVCSGSGGSLLGDFLASGAEVFVTGDIRYHDARAVEDAGRALIDIGHFASEHIMVDALCKHLGWAVAEAGWDVRIEACDLERDPFEMV